MRLEQLTAEHLDAILEFETSNRDYFSAAVPDRGDGFFANYPARHASLLAMLAAGTDIFHVLVVDGGAIAGRRPVGRVDVGCAEAWVERRCHHPSSLGPCATVRNRNPGLAAPARLRLEVERV